MSGREGGKKKPLKQPKAAERVIIEKESSGFLENKYSIPFPSQIKNNNNNKNLQTHLRNLTTMILLGLPSKRRSKRPLRNWPRRQRDADLSALVASRNPESELILRR
jgi:hypothetical protein